MSVYWQTIGRWWRSEPRHRRFLIQFRLKLVSGMFARHRARVRRSEQVIAERRRRESDARSAQIVEFIDDDLRHAHARDGIACPICGAAAGQECVYGLGYGAPKWRGPDGQRFPGRVHTRRLMQFHAPNWPEVQWVEPKVAP